MDTSAAQSTNAAFITKIKNDLYSILEQNRKDIIVAAKSVLRLTRNENLAAKKQLVDWISESKLANFDRYSSYLHSESEFSSLKVKAVKAEFAGNGHVGQEADCSNNIPERELGPEAKTCMFSEEKNLNEASVLKLPITHSIVIGKLS